MNDMPAPRGARKVWPAALLVGLGVLAAGGVGVYAYRRSQDEPPPVIVTSTTGEVSEARLDQFCGACHTVPPPDTFPRSAWKEQVEQGYTFFSQAGMPLQAPPIDQVVRYYEQRAPEELPPARYEDTPGPPPVRFEPTSYPALPDAVPARISNVNLVHLFDERRLDVLATEMYWSKVLALRPYEASPKWQVLADDKTVQNPAHAEVIDLDGDGIKDVLVANLGSFTPTDVRGGSVLWLRGTADGKFRSIPLLENVGRVADVQAADFRGTGRKDLVVAVFGWRNTGEILFLENQTTDWDHPKFVPHVLDKRHGGIHVPVADLNGDGKPDFVALISQEHETVVAFLNEGSGKFREETLYTAPHPAYGSSGIQLVDLNDDGKLDVLYTNGDVLDRPYLLKPYHTIQWLENRGTFPFVHHALTPMYGVHRAVAADLAGTGRKDIVAVSFLPAEGFPQRREKNLDGVIYLEQTAPGRFVRHALKAGGACDHVSCAVGDVYGTGRLDLVAGHFSTDRGEPALTIWRNLGPEKGR
jgi:hypothetical protein